MRAKFINEANFEQGQDPKKALGLGRLYNIDFFYADHPSIEPGDVAAFIENLGMTISDIDPNVKYDIRITDFADGIINFQGSKLSGDDMLDMLKAKREASMDDYENNLASWDFGDANPGVNNNGVPYDPSEYETEYCDNCGEEINGNNELTGDGYCEACSEEDAEEEYED